MCRVVRPRMFTVMVRIIWKIHTGFLPERVPMPEEPMNEMKVVLKLPRPMENHNGRLRFTPPIISHPSRHGHDIISRPSRGSGLMAAQPVPPRELIVSIPFTALCQQEEEPLGQETEPMEAAEEQHGHSSHHKHKKHKKHKKHHHHHHHASAPQEEVRGQVSGSEMGLGVYPPMTDVIKNEPSSYTAPPIHSTPNGAIKTVAPLRIQVPKPSPMDSSRSLSKHKTHSHSHRDEDSSVQVSERHSRPPQISQDRDSFAPGALPSGKHMHTTTHKHHHHKHKEKRHHRRSSGYQGDEHVTGYHGNEDVISGDDDDGDDNLNEWGQAVVMRITPPTRPRLGGKPTAFMKVAEEKKTSTNDEFSPVGSGSEKLQTSSREGHKHHKKKKKKHRKHSKHSFSHSEPEVSPPVARLSGMESEDSQQGYSATTPLSMGSKSTTTAAQVHAHPVATIPQHTLVASREPTLVRSPIKESRRLSQEASGIGHSTSGEVRRSSQDSGGSSSSSCLPLRRLSRDKRTAKLEAQSPDVQPPPHKRSRMDDEKTPPSLKFDISQTKGLDIEPRDTPSPIISTQQLQPSLRHQTSHGSSDSVASTPVSVASTPVSVARPSLGEARRSSIGGEKTQTSSASAMAPSPPVQNPAEMKTPQGKAYTCKTREVQCIPFTKSVK